MKTKLLIATLFTVGLMQSQNLLTNGNLEAFTDDAPNSWTITKGTTEKETTLINEGISSLKATPTAALPWETPSFWISQGFTISDLKTYTLKFDYFIPGDASTASSNINNLTYEITKSSSGSIFAPAPAPTTILEFGVWKTITYDFKIAQFTAPTTSASMMVTFIAGSQFSGKTIFFDNIVIAEKSTLGTADFDKKTNPIEYVSKDEIKLTNDFKNSSYTIYSLEGKAVKRSSNHSSDSIEISGLANGVYLLKLNNLSTSVKFIKK